MRKRLQWAFKQLDRQPKIFKELDFSVRMHAYIYANIHNVQIYLCLCIYNYTHTVHIHLHTQHTCWWKAKTAGYLTPLVSNPSTKGNREHQLLTWRNDLLYLLVSEFPFRTAGKWRIRWQVNRKLQLPNNINMTCTCIQKSVFRHFTHWPNWACWVHGTYCIFIVLHTLNFRHVWASQMYQLRFLFCPENSISYSEYAKQNATPTNLFHLRLLQVHWVSCSTSFSRCSALL